MMTTDKLSSGFLGAVKFCMGLDGPDADISGLGGTFSAFRIPNSVSNFNYMQFIE